MFAPENAKVDEVKKSTTAQILPQPIAESRTHLQDYLNFYCKLTDPGYAVLVTGAWGTGKTFQVKNCIPDGERYYISLFGVQTIEQVHAEVFAAAFPTLNKAGRFVEQVSETAKGVGGLVALAGAAPTLFTAMFRRDLKPDCVLIFDDLERSRLPMEDVLGAINSYVEQMGFRVIVIAHDGKLAEGFLAMKEKTFGQVIRVKSQIKHAFNSFLGRILDQRAKEFVSSYGEVILDTFAQSGEESLRVLRHLIEDLERLFRSLTENHLGNDAAMRTLVALFVAFDIEVRTGRLNAKDLKNRSGTKYVAALRANASAQAAARPPLILANDKYPTIELEDNILNDDLLVEMFVDGLYDHSNIQASLDNSVFFLKPSDAPPWRIVINFDELDDVIVEEGRLAMQKQFDDREVTDSGELLHIFALRLMMADHGITEKTLEEEKDACRKYIDDLLIADRLPPRETDWRWWDSFDTAHQGYGYWVTEETRPFFKELWDHLILSRETAFERQLPSIAEKLLTLIASNAKMFFESVSPTNNGDNPYAYIPVLYAIEPRVFVDTWLAAPRENWRYIKYAIDNRFEHGRLERDFPIEVTWADEVYRLLLERATNSRGLASLRIRRIVPKVFAQRASPEAVSK